MARELHELTVDELEAAIRALGRASVDLGYIRDRMRSLGNTAAVFQLQVEDERVDAVLSVLARAIRKREKEDRERAEAAAAKASEETAPNPHAVNIPYMPGGVPVLGDARDGVE